VVVIDWKARGQATPRITRSELRYYKRLARAAVAHQNGEVALRVCTAIVDYDIFLAESPNHQPAGFERVITTEYPALCQTCGLDIPRGTRVFWYDNDRCVHLHCAPALPDRLPLEQP
jgi:hypothetical protein